MLKIFTNFCSKAVISSGSDWNCQLISALNKFWLYSKGRLGLEELLLVAPGIEVAAGRVEAEQMLFTGAGHQLPGCSVGLHQVLHVVVVGQVHAVHQLCHLYPVVL